MQNRFRQMTMPLFADHGRESTGKAYVAFAWLIGAVLILLALQVVLKDYIVDDTFIHLTFARNLAEGHGFSFNPDIPTYGVTAPLWTLLLAFLAKFFMIGPALAKALSIICGVSTVLAFRLLAGTIGLTDRSANAATMVWGVNVWLTRWTASGMEAALAVLLLILAFDAQVKSRGIAGIWLGLALLCRPESAVIAVIFALDRWRTGSIRQAFGLLGVIVLVNLPWQVYAFYTFGSVSPNTALVKGGLGLPAFNDFLLGLKRTALIIGGSHSLELLVILIGLSLVVLHRIMLSDFEIRVGALLITWAIFPAVIYLAQGVFVTSRYLLIGMPALTLLMFMILDGLEFRRKIHWWKYGRYILVVVILFQQLLLTFKVTLPHVEAFKPTIAALTRLADELRLETPPGSVVAVGDVGVVGFYSHRYVVDLEGLVTDEMIPYRAGVSLDELILSGRYLDIRPVDYLIDKSMIPDRLVDGSSGGYRLLDVEPIPGGLVDTAEEQWYYTLYKINAESNY